jgi:hypothetical protein
LAGSYASALGVAVFAWGTATGTALLIYAITTHLVSTADALRQGAFPRPGWFTSCFAAAGGLATFIYAPAVAAAAFLAYPVSSTSGGTYLIDRRAYFQAHPRQGELVWYQLSPSSTPRLGRIVGGAGQAVEWSENQLRIDGREAGVSRPFRPSRTPRELEYGVPDGYHLVEPVANATANRLQRRLVLVPSDLIIGRAWAHIYPLRERKLL